MNSTKTVPAKPKKQKQKKNQNLVVQVQPVSQKTKVGRNLVDRGMDSANVRYQKTTYGSPAKPITERLGFTVCGNTAGNTLLSIGVGGPPSYGLNDSANATSWFYGVNPGNSYLFPVLSQTAKNFNKYKFSHLRFKYIPIGSGYAPGTQTGNVIFVWNPDARDPYNDSAGALSALEHRQHSIWTPFSFEIPKNDLFSTRYINVVDNQNGLIPPGSDIREFDVGNFTGGTISCPTNGTSVGYIEVEYAVELYKPINRTPATTSSQYATNSSMIRYLPTTTSALTSGSLYTISTSPLNLVTNGQNYTPSSSSTFAVSGGNYLLVGCVNCKCSNTGEYFTNLFVDITDNSSGSASRRAYTMNSNGSSTNFPNQMTVNFSIPLIIFSGFSNLVGFAVSGTTSGGGTWVVSGGGAYLNDTPTTYLTVVPLP